MKSYSWIDVFGVYCEENKCNKLLHCICGNCGFQLHPRTWIFQSQPRIFMLFWFGFIIIFIKKFHVHINEANGLSFFTSNYTLCVQCVPSTFYSRPQYTISTTPDNFPGPFTVVIHVQLRNSLRFYHNGFYCNVLRLFCGIC